MKQLLIISTLLFTVFAQGCATERYVVDTKGIDEDLYKTDLAIELGTKVAIQVGTGKVLEGKQETDRIVKNCLDRRGYKVLN